MKARSYSKVNLWLHVQGLRADGFHDIETVFHTISLHDYLNISQSNAGVVTVEMSLPPLSRSELPSPDDNLVSKAARVLAENADSSPGAYINVRKNIPLGAGLAGGSGNAAATLVALNDLWGLGFKRTQLIEIATELGSDVPFMVEGGTVVGRGRGEKLSRLPHSPSLWLVLGISSHELSTPEVYAGWREGGTGPTLDEFRGALATGDPGLIAQQVRNDLEPSAFALRPDLVQAKASMCEAGAVGAFLSGSGPTIVGIARDEEHAHTVARDIDRVFDRVEVARSHPNAVELEV